MKKLFTASAVVIASLALSTAAFAGGSGGYKSNSAKTLTFALSGAKHQVRVRTGMPPAPQPVRMKKSRNRDCGCGGIISVDAGSYQDHKVYSGHHGTGGASTAGNYLSAKWKGGAQIEFQGSGFAVGGAAIISGGGKKRPGNGMPSGAF